MSTQKSYKEKAVHREPTAVILCAVIAVVLVLILIFSGVFSKTGADGDTYVPPVAELSGDTSSDGSEQTSETETDVSENVSRAETETVKTDNSAVNKGTLILVNNENKCTFPSEAELVKVASGKTKSYKLGSGNEQLLQITLSALNGMLDEFNEKSGKTDITLLAAYYTYEKQATLYENALKKYTADEAAIWAVMPGASEHHTGLAVNLTIYPSNGQSIGEGEYAWITSNAHKYGFILRYPEEKQNITFVKDDKNHFRYVGTAHATYMYRNSLCLEEYLSMLRLNHSVDNMLSVTAEDGTYYIYYVAASEGEYTDIPVPSGSKYEISGNNSDGYIITVAP